MKRHARHARRDVELVIVVLVALAVTAALVTTWLDTSEDRRATRESTYHLTDALAESVEAHFEAVLRDASNAAVSAAMLIEQSGRPPAAWPEADVHREFKRELWNDEATARLVLLDPAWRVLGSSAEFPVRGDTRSAPPRDNWSAMPVGTHEFRIGSVERSPIGNEAILPYWCAVYDRQGGITGWVRAEIRIEHFTRTYQSLSALQGGSFILVSHDGTTLLRTPVREEVLGTRREGVRRFSELAHGKSGHLEFRSPLDGVTRLYSWRRMARQPLGLAVGLDSEQVMAPWQQRTRLRLAVAGGISAGLVVLAWLLALHLRRLERLSDSAERLERRYGAALENASLGIAIADLEGRWQHVNPALCAMLGYTREELLALDTETVTAPEFRAGRKDILLDLAQGRALHAGREKCFLHKDGHRVWVQINGTVLRESAQERPILIEHIQDISVRKRAEADLQVLNQQLEQRVEQRTAELQQANEDLDAFAYSAAHDLRGPAERLEAFVDVLEGELPAPDERVRRRLDTIRRQSRTMSTLVHDLLALSRAQRSTLRPAAVNMDDLVASVRDDLARESAGRNVEWDLQPLPAALADHGLVRLVFVNLLGNALKYTRGRDPARIRVAPFDAGEPALAGYEVADNGAGFDMAYADDLFTPFKRLHSAAQFEGSGIGLATVQRIVVRSGGRIWGEGRLGEGAVFRFTLPVLARAAAS